MKNMMKILLVILLTGIIAFGCGKKKQEEVITIEEEKEQKVEELQDFLTAEELSKPVATLRGEPLTIEYLLDRFNIAGPRTQHYLQPDVDKLKTFLDTEIIQDLLYEKALEQGYDEKEVVEEQAKASREKAMLDLVQKRDISDKVKITKNEIVKFYEENLDEKFTKEEQVKVNKIVKSDRAKGEEALQMVKSGEDFRRIAQQYSTDKIFRTILRKGTKRHADIEEQAFALENPGDISELIESNGQFIILQLEERTEKEVLPLEEVEDRIKNELFMEETRKLKEELFTEWKNKFDVKIHEDILENLTNKEKDSDKVLVEITSGHNVTVGDFASAYHFPKGRDDLEERKKFLKRLIERPLMTAIAEEKGYDDSKEVKRVVEREKKIRIVQEFYNNELIDKVDVTEQEIKDFYEKSKVEIRARHILVEDMEVAKEVMKKLKGGSDFAALVKEYSKDPGTVPRGGDLGYFTWGKMVDEFQAAAFKLGKGETSDIVETDFGYHIIQVLDRRDAKIRPYEEMKRGIENIVRGIKISRNIESYLEELKKEANFEINQENLEFLTNKLKELEKSKEVLEEVTEKQQQ